LERLPDVKLGFVGLFDRESSMQVFDRSLTHLGWVTRVSHSSPYIARKLKLGRVETEIIIFSGKNTTLI
jgi:hypothetical protein